MPAVLQRARRCAGGRGRGRAARVASSPSTSITLAERLGVVHQRGAVQGHQHVAARLHALRRQRRRRGRRPRGSGRGCRSSCSRPARRRSVIPSAARFSTASSEVQSSRSLTRSVTTGSPPRASTSRASAAPTRRGPTATFSFVAASAAAIVELTSPATSTRSAGCSLRSASTPAITSAVCSAWLPEPTPRLASGCAHPEPLDEAVRERAVVVLAGVEQAHVDALALVERRDDGRHLHEVGPRADDGEDRGHGGESRLLRLA